MKRLTPCVLAVLALASVDLRAGSQSFTPIAVPIRDGGTYHVADGTWTRGTSTVSLGNDILYNNTCSALNFRPLGGDTLVDEGRVPGTFSPFNFGSRPGCALSYAIDGFQIGYCSDAANAQFTYSFFGEHTGCTSTAGMQPLATIALTGLPGSLSGVTACWTVNVDIAAMPFTIPTGATNPRFVFSMSSAQSQADQGPIIAGEPSTCARYDGTSWDSVVDLSEGGTGMGTLDEFYVESGPTTPGCYFFGGQPFASFWLELYGDTCAPDGMGQSAFCAAGQLGALPCPCGNDPPVGSASGCSNSFGTGAQLSGNGTPSLSADTVQLLGAGMPVSSPVLFFQGTLRTNAGQGQVFGDGLRCAGGSVTRLGTSTNSTSGSSHYPSGAQSSVSVQGGVTSPGSRTYQAWYRNAASFCTPAGFNTSNGWEISWGA